MPTYGVQGYLRECLDSILNQSFTDFELIAVDDRSPDHCADILDEYAGRDARVRVIHLDENVGLGLARNAGLDEARGEYVWFVDSDDWLPGGALRAVVTRLRATSPDLLVFDHDRVGWLDERQPSGGRPVLSRREGPDFALADDPELLTLFTVAWNKVVRREFLLRTGYRFDVGWYEDLPFTFPLLVAADRIAVLSRICYHYRRRRRDAITSTRSLRHFEVFEQWDRVFGHLDRLGERADPFREAIFARMVWHLLVVLSRTDRVPRGRGREYFSRLSAYYHRYRPAGTTDPADRLTRLRDRLIATDNYSAFLALRGTRNLGRASDIALSTVVDGAEALARSAAARAQLVVGRLLYHLFLLLPVDRQLAVFAAYWYRGYSCNPAALMDKTMELAPDVRSLWIVNRPHVGSVPTRVPHVVAGTMRYYYVLARARWLINNVNFPDFVVKRRDCVHVQTHHGTPIKVMGLDQRAYPVGAQGMDMNRLLQRSDRWDFSLTSNPHSTEVWARAYPCGYTTLEFGYPRNDRLALADARDVSQLRRDLDLPEDALVILYAPTHREYTTGFSPMLDLEEFAAALGPDTILLVREHYFYADDLGLGHPRIRDVSGHPRVEDLMLAADVLVSDYSSVIVDFAVLDRPIVVYAPDWDAYVRTRGVTFDLLAEPPGVVATSPADLVDVFRTGSAWGDPATKAREQFRARFCALDDGYASERVIRRVMADALPGSILPADVCFAEDPWIETAFVEEPFDELRPPDSRFGYVWAPSGP